MTRKRFRHLLLEVARRVHLSQNGDLKGFGETAKFYDRNWRMKCHPGEVGGYRAAWESEALKALRASVGM